jgi:hypothetical protein
VSAPPELLEPGGALSAADAVTAAPAAAAATVPQHQAAAAQKPQRPVLDASFLVLNPDEEDVVEEDYSSEEYSDSD